MAYFLGKTSNSYNTDYRIIKAKNDDEARKKLINAFPMNAKHVVYLQIE